MKKIITAVCTLLLLGGCSNMRSDAGPDDNPDLASKEEIVKIHFERSGGFAGMITNVDIDSDSLPPDERTALAALVSDAQFFALPATITNATPTGADRFNYKITIESDGQKHTVETTDGAAPATLIPLIDWLSGAARRAQRSGGS